MGFSGIGITELLVILVILMLLFGTKRLKNIGSDLGSAIRGFRSSMANPDRDDKVEDEPPNTGPAADSQVSAAKSSHATDKDRL